MSFITSSYFYNDKMLGTQHLIDICNYLPLVTSLSTTSVTSNNFIGRGIFLLADTVFKSPDKILVRATWNSNVFGLLMRTVL